jgi:hypothetical protein
MAEWAKRTWSMWQERPRLGPKPAWAVWSAEGCVVIVDLREHDAFMISEVIRIDVSL